MVHVLNVQSLLLRGLLLPPEMVPAPEVRVLDVDYGLAVPDGARLHLGLSRVRPRRDEAGVSGDGSERESQTRAGGSGTRESGNKKLTGVTVTIRYECVTASVSELRR